MLKIRLKLRPAGAGALPELGKKIKCKKRIMLEIVATKVVAS